MERDCSGVILMLVAIASGLVLMGLADLAARW